MRYYDYVNTKMGSLNSRRYSNGNCYPVIAVPRGMNFFTLQTNGKEGGWFYSPADKYLEGVKLTHMPSPWLRDYGSVLMWGDKGESVADSFWTGYDPERAILEPAYMSVLYHRNSCKIELSPTDSAAVIKLSFGERGPVSRLRFKCDFSDYK
jgi:putative alpha-1,2-mannosidase